MDFTEFHLDSLVYTFLRRLGLCCRISKESNIILLYYVTSATKSSTNNNYF